MRGGELRGGIGGFDGNKTNKLYIHFLLSCLTVTNLCFSPTYTPTVNFCTAMSDEYEQYNYEEHGKKDRKHGSKKESAQHKEPSECLSS